MRISQRLISSLPIKNFFRLVLLAGILIQIGLPIARVAADGITDYNSYCIQLPCAYYSPNSTTNCSASSADAALTGSDNEEKAYNYFRAKGLNDIQTSAVIGNLMLESSMNPTAMEIGGNSNNPADADPKGWGIAQWTPGSKITGIASGLNITGPIYELSTQLDIVWGEMTGTAPTGYQNVADGLKQQTDLASAVDFFQRNFESGVDFADRLTAAQTALDKYGSGSTPGSSTASTAATGSCSATGSVNCTSATGNARILCEAEAYNGVYYRWGGGHQGYDNFTAGCPDPAHPPNNQPTGAPPDPTNGNLSGNPSPCATDCSGLIDIAVQVAFGTDLHGTAVLGFETDTTNWKEVPIESVQPGDIVVRTTEHVEIVDHYDPSTKVLYTFGSHETGTQTSGIKTSLSDWTGAYRYVGQQGSGG